MRCFEGRHAAADSYVVNGDQLNEVRTKYSAEAKVQWQSNVQHVWEAIIIGPVGTQ